LKRFSMSATNSFLSRVPSLSGSGGEILGVEPTAQFALVEGAVMIAGELVEHLRSSGEVDRAIIIGVERFQEALRPCWCRGAISMMARAVNMLLFRMPMFTTCVAIEIA
jgi:hypothetical protein